MAARYIVAESAQNLADAKRSTELREGILRTSQFISGHTPGNSRAVRSLRRSHLTVNVCVKRREFRHWVAGWCLVVGLSLLAVPLFIASAVMAANVRTEAPRVLQRQISQPSITLSPLFLPQAGSETAFYITERSFQQTTHTSGIFSLVGSDSSFEEIAVRVHLTGDFMG